MTLQASLYSRLTSDPTIFALAESRIYPRDLPELEKGEKIEPSIVYSFIGRSDEYETDGPAIKKPHVGILVLAEEYDTAWQLADAVEGCLMPDGAPFIGTLGAPGGVVVQAVSLVDSFDFIDENMPLLGWFAVRQEYEIWVAT